MAAQVSKKQMNLVKRLVEEQLKNNIIITREEIAEFVNCELINYGLDYQIGSGHHLTRAFNRLKAEGHLIYSSGGRGVGTMYLGRTPEEFDSIRQRYINDEAIQRALANGVDRSIGQVKRVKNDLINLIGRPHVKDFMFEYKQLTQDEKKDILDVLEDIAMIGYNPEDGN
jgi:hypothetical protein